MTLFFYMLEYSSSLHDYLFISWRISGYIHILVIVNRKTTIMTERVSVEWYVQPFGTGVSVKYRRYNSQKP